MQVRTNTHVEAAFVGNVRFDAVFLAICKILINGLAKAFFERTNACTFIGNEVPYTKQAAVQKLVRCTV